jgi:fatty-acyl-CoA synthase/long-chain acyl-CoA synthetase
MIVGQIVQSNALRYPNKLAVVNGSSRLTWKEVNDRINGFANGLLGLGVKKGDRVAIVAENCHQYFEFLFAAAKIGAPAVCINYRFSTEQLSKIMKISTPKVIVVEGSLKDMIEALRPELSSVEKYIGLGSSHGYDVDFDTLVLTSSNKEPVIEISEDDPCTICFSSGTTGEPKAAVITHKNRIATCIQLVLAHSATRDKVFLASMGLYAAASHQFLLGYAFVGGTIVIINFAAEDYLEAIQKERVNVIQTNHTFYVLTKEYLAKSKRTFDVTSIQLLQSAGQALSYEQWREVLAFFHHPTLQKGLAMTEAGLVTVGVPEELRAWLAPDATEDDKRKFNSLGKPSIGTEMRIVNTEDQELPAGEVGEIVARGDNVVKSFWNQPHVTENILRGGWLHTGDLGMIDEEGYMYLMGRRDERIRTGGYNVYPIEIERVMSLHPSVVEAAVLGVPDERWGEMIVAAVIPEQGAQVSEEELKNLCRQHLAGFQVPKKIFFLDEFPRHPVWKRVVKKELAQQVTSLLEAGRSR